MNRKGSGLIWLIIIVGVAITFFVLLVFGVIDPRPDISEARARAEEQRAELKARRAREEAASLPASSSTPVGP